MFFNNWSGQLFALRLLQGRLAELRESVALVVDSKPGLVAWRVALAYLCHETGDVERAEEIFREVTGPPLDSLPVDGLWLFTMCLLSDLALYLDDRRRYDELERLLRPFADRTVIVAYAAFSFGPVALRLGLLGVARGDFDQAEVDLRAALESSRSVGSWPWVAAAEVGLAFLCDMRGGPGDRERARALRDSVSGAARENGWSVVGRHTAGVIAPARPAPVSPW
jgi:hypothetical protein